MSNHEEGILAAMYSLQAPIKFGEHRERALEAIRAYLNASGQVLAPKVATDEMELAGGAVETRDIATEHRIRFVKFTGFTRPACLDLPVGAVGVILRQEQRLGKDVTFVSFPCRPDIPEVDLFDDEFVFWQIVVAYPPGNERGACVP